MRLLIEAVFSSHKFWIMKLQSQVGQGNRVALSEELGIRHHALYLQLHSPMFIAVTLNEDSTYIMRY